MKEAAIHAGPVEQPHGSRVAIRENRFGSVLARSRAQSLGDRVERFVPGDARKAPLTLRAHSFLRIEETLRRVLPVQVPGDLSAEETARDGMIGIAAKRFRVTVFHLHQQRASVGTIQGANRVQRCHNSWPHPRPYSKEYQGQTAFWSPKRGEEAPKERRRGLESAEPSQLPSCRFAFCSPIMGPWQLLNAKKTSSTFSLVFSKSTATARAMRRSPTG